MNRPLWPDTVNTNLPGFATSGLTQISLVNAAWRAPAVAGVRRA